MALWASLWESFSAHAPALGTHTYTPPTTHMTPTQTRTHTHTSPRPQPVTLTAFALLDASHCGVHVHVHLDVRVESEAAVALGTQSVCIALALALHAASDFSGRSFQRMLCPWRRRTCSTRQKKDYLLWNLRALPKRRLKVQRTKKHTLALSVFGSLALAVLFALFLAFFNLCFSFIVTVQKSLDAKIHSKKNAGKHNHNNNNTAISCAIEKSVSEKQASVRCEFFLRLKRTSAQCDRSQSAKKYARTHQMENPLKLSGKLIVAGKINVKLKRNLWK